MVVAKTQLASQASLLGAGGSHFHKEGEEHGGGRGKRLATQSKMSPSAADWVDYYELY